VLKPAAEWTGASECVVLCTACAIKINVNGYYTGYGAFVKMEMGAIEEWQKNNNNSDHVIIRWWLQNHVFCKQSFRLYNFRSLTRNVLQNISKFKWSLCHSLPISIYRFVPPIIRLPVLAVLDGSSDACLRPLLVNSIIEKIQFINLKIDFYNKTILTSLKEFMMRQKVKTSYILTSNQ